MLYAAANANDDDNDVEEEVIDEEDNTPDKDAKANQGDSDNEESVKSNASLNNGDDSSLSTATSISSVMDSVTNKQVYPQDVAGQLQYLRDQNATNKIASDKLRKKLTKERE